MSTKKQRQDRRRARYIRDLAQRIDMEKKVELEEQLKLPISTHEEAAAWTGFAIAGSQIAPQITRNHTHAGLAQWVGEYADAMLVEYRRRTMHLE